MIISRFQCSSLSACLQAVEQLLGGHRHELCAVGHAVRRSLVFDQAKNCDADSGVNISNSADPDWLCYAPLPVVVEVRDLALFGLRGRVCLVSLNVDLDDPRHGHAS